VGTTNRARAARMVALIALCSFAATASAATEREEMDLAVRDLDADHDLATAAVYALQAGGAPAAEAIRDAWPSLSLLAQKRAIAALRTLAREHDAAIDALIEAARSHHGQLRDLALGVLRQNPSRGSAGLVVLLDEQRVGDRAASLLARTNPDFAIEPLLAALAADGGADRRGVREALAVAVQRAESPEPQLFAWLQTKPPAPAVASAALGLSTLDAQRELLASFIEYAIPSSTDFATTWRLLQSAGAAAPSTSIDQWVRSQLTEPEEWMLRASAVDALTARGLREQTRTLLRDPYPRVRVRAAMALSGDRKSLTQRAVLARKDAWPMVRAAAVTSLRSESDALPVIVASVDDSMSVVRAAAIEVLSATSHDEGWDRIHGRLRAKNEWPSVTAKAIEYVIAHCRTDAAESLFRVVMRAAPSYARTEDLNNAARAVEALRALGTGKAEAFIDQLRSTPEVPPTLKMALSRPLAAGAKCAPPSP
jgi:hypothetical protein